MSYASSSTVELERETWSERTLAIIKPEAYEDSPAIIDVITKNNFTILAKRVVRMSPEQTADLYSPHYGRCYLPHLVAHMSSGDVIALVLAGNDAVQRWKQLMGPARVAEAQAYWPDSVRACYGRRTKYGDYFNAVHGSESPFEAQREIHFFFPGMVVGPVLSRWQIEDYLEHNVYPTLSKALTELTKTKPLEPLLFIADFLEHHNPNCPEITAPAPFPQEAIKCHTPPPSEETDDV